MTAVISKKATEALSIAAFQAAYNMAKQFAPRHTHDFINGGVQHKFLSYSFDFISLVKITRGAKFKIDKRLPLTPALGAEKIFRDSFAGQRSIGWSSSEFKVTTRDAMAPIFGFIAANVKHLNVYMEVYEDADTCAPRLDLYIETKDLAKEDTLRMWITIDSVELVNTNNGKVFF